MAARILVVDDDEAVRQALAEMLGEEGYVVACARDGQEALEFLRHPILPTLVLLDLMMPGVSGWQVLDCMRASPRLANVRVIVLTAFEVPDDLPSGHPVLHKPMESPVLLDLVSDVLAQDVLAQEEDRDDGGARGSPSSLASS